MAFAGRVMNFDWLADGRKIPDGVMHYIRAMGCVPSVCLAKARRR